MSSSSRNTLIACPQGLEKLKLSLKRKGWVRSIEYEKDYQPIQEASKVRIRKIFNEKKWNIDCITINNIYILVHEKVLKDEWLNQTDIKSEQPVNFAWIEQQIEENYLLAKGLSPSTWRRFLEGKEPINNAAFKAFCEALGEDWEEIAGLKQENSQLGQEDSTETHTTEFNSINGFIPYSEFTDNPTTPKESDAIESHESVPAEVGANNGTKLNGNHHHNPSQAYSNNGDFHPSSESENYDSQTINDSSANSTADESYSELFQLDNYGRNPGSSTPRWNFMNPGIPLLVSVGILASLFGLSWLASWYGVTNHLKGQLPKAQVAYSLALKLNPMSAEAKYNLGVMYEEQQNYEKAHGQYQLAIEGGNIEAYSNQARLYILEGNYQAAVSLIRIGLPLAQDDLIKYTMLKNRGWARLSQNRYEEAKGDLLKAIQLKNNKSAAYCLLAQVLEKQGDNDGAIAGWEKCEGYAYQAEYPEEDTWRDMASKRLNYEGSEQ